MIFLYLFFFFFFFSKELKFQANAVHNHLNLLDCTIVKLEVGNLQLSREFPQDFRYYFKPGTPIQVHPVLSTNHTRALGDMKIS